VDVQAQDPAEVAPDVFLVRGRDVNWVILREGGELTLIDGGYPGDADVVDSSIRQLGHRPEDVRAIVLTHAHADHLGAVNPFHDRYGTPVLLDPVEVPHARREYLEQAGPKDIVANIWRPGVLAWTLRITRNGAMRDVAAPHATAFELGRPLDLPGRPTPIPTHGHTSGHCAFHLPGAGAVVVGDELITGHALWRREGPQLLLPMFQHGGGDVSKALDTLAALDADLILPGHGPAHHGSIAAAVAVAREPTPY
jgi:glyoxylase-like metal-dependent hydrolase (beta-lactamase superfamily II)